MRTQIATLLRSLLTSTASSDTIKAQVLALSGTYGDLDGENNYHYATVFAQVYKTLTTDQKTNLAALRKSILSGTYADGTPFDYSTCTTPFLYSDAITGHKRTSPYITNTDSVLHVIHHSSPDSGALRHDGHCQRHRERRLRQHPRGHSDQPHLHGREPGDRQLTLTTPIRVPAGFTVTS